MASRLSGYRLFLDSAYAIALAAPADEYHQKARSLASEVLRARIGIITTREVMFEVANALCMPRYRSAAVATLNAFETDPLIEIIDHHPELYRAAFDLFQHRMDKEWSLTDCLSFVIMHQHGLTEALTSDEHLSRQDLARCFASQPFETLMKPASLRLRAKLAVLISAQRI